MRARRGRWLLSGIISVRHLSKSYGAVQAVDSLSFDVEQGQVLGFVGANGAGKTTTMRIMATLELPTSGSIEICGFDVLNFPTEVRRCIGWMPDAFGGYEHMTVYEYLDFYARAFGFKGAERRSRIDEVMDFTDLVSIAERQMAELSKGMGQRLCLGRSLLNDPRVLILDEPASGLDPKARVDLIRLIQLLAEDGKTIFISSHILSELAEMCTTMLFIDNGRLVHHGSAESLMSRHADGVVVSVRIDGDPSGFYEWVLMNRGVELLEETREGGRMVIKEDSTELLNMQLRKMLSDGIAVAEFYRDRRTLENAFVSILSNSSPPPLPVIGMEVADDL